MACMQSVERTSNDHLRRERRVWGWVQFYVNLRLLSSYMLHPTGGGAATHVFVSGDSPCPGLSTDCSLHHPFAGVHVFKHKCGGSWWLSSWPDRDAIQPLHCSVTTAPTSGLVRLPFHLGFSLPLVRVHLQSYRHVTLATYTPIFSSLKPEGSHARLVSTNAQPVDYGEEFGPDWLAVDFKGLCH